MLGAKYWGSDVHTLRIPWRLLRGPLPWQMWELWHENIATFLGFFVAPGVSALVLEHCAQGSLEDLLRNEDLRLDWTFKASLVLDMIRVRTLLKPGAVEAMGREGRQEMLRFPRPGLFPLWLTEKNLTVWQRVREAGRFPGVRGNSERSRGPSHSPQASGTPIIPPQGVWYLAIGISLTAASSPETVLWLDALCCRSLTMVMQSSWTLSGLPAPGQPRKVSSGVGRRLPVGSETSVYTGCL